MKCGCSHAFLIVLDGTLKLGAKTNPPLGWFHQVFDYGNKADRDSLGVSEKKEATYVLCNVPVHCQPFGLYHGQVRRRSQGQEL